MSTLTAPRPGPSRLTALAICLALALGACSAGGESSTPTTAPAAAPTTTDGAAPTTETRAPETTTTAAPTTTQPTATSPTWEELQRAEIPSLCGHEPTALVNGAHPGIAPGQGSFTLLPELRTGQPSVVEDLPAEGGPVTAVVASCDAGGVAWPNLVVFFGPGARFHSSTFLDGPDASRETVDPRWAQTWNEVGVTSPGREGVLRLAPDGDSLTVFLTAEIPGDASCCPSGEIGVTVRPHPDGVQLVELVWAGGD